MDRRSSRRFLCAELVEARWKDKGGRLRRSVANLEDISRAGACLQMDAILPVDTEIVVQCEGVDLPGTVCYCRLRDGAHFIGVKFAEGTQWSRRRYRPQHLLDPDQLVRRSGSRLRLLRSSTVM